MKQALWRSSAPTRREFDASAERQRLIESVGLVPGLPGRVER
jgi:hypothetical protein